MAHFCLEDKRSRRVCTECGRRNMSSAAGDIYGLSRWLCVDCKNRYNADHIKKTGAPVSRQVFANMLRF